LLNRKEAVAAHIVAAARSLVVAAAAEAVPVADRIGRNPVAWEIPEAVGMDQARRILVALAVLAAAAAAADKVGPAAAAGTAAQEAGIGLAVAGKAVLEEGRSQVDQEEEGRSQVDQEEGRNRADREEAHIGPAEGRTGQEEVLRTAQEAGHTAQEVGRIQEEVHHIVLVAAAEVLRIGQAAGRTLCQAALAQPARLGQLEYPGPSLAEAEGPAQRPWLAAA